MRDQSRSCEAAFNGARWRRRFHNALALLAGELRADMTNDLEVGGNVLQNLGYVLCEEAQGTVAIRAAILPWLMPNNFAGKVRGQRLARGPGLGSGLVFRYGCWAVFFSRRLLRLCLFKLSLALLNLDGDLLALAAEYQIGRA